MFKLFEHFALVDCDEKRDEIDCRDVLYEKKSGRRVFHEVKECADAAIQDGLVSSIRLVSGLLDGNFDLAEKVVVAHCLSLILLHSQSYD